MGKEIKCPGGCKKGLLPRDGGGTKTCPTCRGKGKIWSDAIEKKVVATKNTTQVQSNTSSSIPKNINNIEEAGVKKPWWNIF